VLFVDGEQVERSCAVFCARPGVDPGGFQAGVAEELGDDDGARCRHGPAWSRRYAAGCACADVGTSTFMPTSVLCRAGRERPAQTVLGTDTVGITNQLRECTARVEGAGRPGAAREGSSHDECASAAHQSRRRGLGIGCGDAAWREAVGDAPFVPPR
jgi:hypothetical protein